MDDKISQVTRDELLEVLKKRYHLSKKKEKTQILDEFSAVSGFHRKHVIRLFRKKSMQDLPKKKTPPNRAFGQRIYDEAVKEALIVIWEAGDRMCGKRLKAILPELVIALERHGHLKLDSEVKKLLLSASSATIDRLLATVRTRSKSRRKRKRVKKVSKQIPVRTFGDWNEPGPGYLEIDFVAHCGGNMADSFIPTLIGTDICTGWTECVPLLVREQSLVVEGLEVIFNQIPFPVKGIDSDNDGAFVNETLLAFCRMQGIEFTRCRPYCKNDQAWVEQKNGSVVRRLVGHERLSGVIAGQTLAHLYKTARLHVNYFQPSFKLISKSRTGARVTKRYEDPMTPCERLMRQPDVDKKVIARLYSFRERLDPLELLHYIREGQAALAKLTSEVNSVEGPGKKTLDQFLSELPELWKLGEVRPTHRKTPTKTRDWRTRKDPFESVWFDVLRWLQQTPDTTAKALFQHLQSEYPGRFPEGQLRTFQRRIAEWRQLMAKQLVYTCMHGGDPIEEVTVIGENAKEHSRLSLPVPSQPALI